MSEEITLNHPWTIYLREPTSSYTKYSVYYSELMRLLRTITQLNTNISDLKENQVQLTNFIIGTPMECALQKRDCSIEYMYQWQQLFPKHIHDFIKHHSKLDNEININIIIISPDDIFMDECYKEPLFTTECEEYKFTKIQNREYVHNNKNLTIKVDIFTCPFPQLEMRIETIEHFNNFVERFIPCFELKKFSPTEHDIKFINEFYYNIELIASNPKSNMIINSYATFRNVRDFDNYGLFPTLLEVANKHKIIATEWNFQENNFRTRIISRINYKVDYINYLISYVEPYYTSILDDYEKISIQDLKLKSKNICILVKFPYYKMVYRQFLYN
jgi:hypothetical protein